MVAGRTKTDCFHCIWYARHRQRDLDLDVMSMYEQELNGWRTIAFEGPRSSKGLLMKESVAKIKQRRILKEQHKEASNALFDGALHRNTWALFVQSTDGIVGRGALNVVAPLHYRQGNVVGDVAEEEGVEEEVEVGEEEEMTLVVEEEEEEQCDVVGEEKEKGGEEEKEEVVWTVQNGLKSFRAMYLLKRQTKMELKELVMKRIKAMQQQQKSAY